MKKILFSVLPVVLTSVVLDAQARYVPYVPKTAEASAGNAAADLADYDKNGDFYITADEVEAELREDAVDKAVDMYKKGISKQEVEKVILNMEDSIEQDAENIIDKLDTDGDELVEPQESHLE